MKQFFQLFGSYNKPYAPLVLILFTAIISVMYVFAPNNLIPFIGGSIILSAFYDKTLPICIYLIANTLSIEMSGSLYLMIGVIVCLCAFSYILKSTEQCPSFYRNMIIFFVICSIMSQLFGPVGNWISLFSAILCSMLLFTSISLVFNKNGIVLFTCIILCGLSIILTTLLLLLNGQDIMSDRGVLLFNEHAKNIAYPIAILPYVIVYIFFNKRDFFNLFTLIVLAGLGLMSLYFIVFTYSRSCLLALCFSGVYIALLSLKPLNIKNTIGICLAFIGLAYFYMQLDIDTDTMYSNLEGGNGRTEIWYYFYGLLKQQGVFLTGLGPGDIKEYSSIGYYAHSAILDFVFKFGILGGIYIFSLIICPFVKGFKSSPFFLGLLILTILMYFTHSTCLSVHFNVLLGFCIGGLQVQKSSDNRNVYV